MLHPRLTPRGSSSAKVWLAEIGDYGAWGDLSYTTRWGSGACGMFEASWTMPLPPDFEHPAVRRGATVELMDGPWRVGSSLVLSEPSRGTGYDDPWQFTATGVGREVEGENSFYAFDNALNTTAIPAVAVDAAIINRGLPWAGRGSSVPIVKVGATDTTDALNTIGSLLTSAADGLGQRWGVGQDNLLRFYADPTAPAWHVVPGAAALGTADDEYASDDFVRYIDSTSGMLATEGAGNARVRNQYGRREFTQDLTQLGPVSQATAAGYAAGILAKSKGRLGWTNGLTLTSNDLLSAGGVPADLALVEAGQMVRLHGVFNDLLETTGQPWLDIIIGEAKYADGAQTIDLSPLGLVSRTLASVVEEVTGLALDAAA